MINKTANCIGSTGLVGRKLAEQLLSRPEFDKVRLFARRPTGLQHQKLEEHIIDFDAPHEWENLVTGDVLFSALGTTLKKAGSKEAQYRVDYEYQLAFAQAAAKNGVSRFVLVSSAGADHNSSFFYPRIKGELDREVSLLPFEKITILRPSILAGNRSEQRKGEHFFLKMMNWLTRFAFKKYKPIKDADVAQAMIVSALQQKEKLQVVTLDEIFILIR